MDGTYKKIAQVANYLTRREGGEIDRLKLVKLLYLADRYHMRKYGRLVTGDYYFAMQYGPVGSTAANMASLSEWLGEEQLSYASKYLSRKDNHTVASINEVDMDELSESDVEALDFAYANFGGKRASDLVDLTHKYPEWVNQKDALDAGAARVPIDTLDFFEDSTLVTDDKFKTESRQLQIARDIYQEENVIKALTN